MAPRPKKNSNYIILITAGLFVTAFCGSLTLWILFSDYFTTKITVESNTGIINSPVDPYFNTIPN